MYENMDLKKMMEDNDQFDPELDLGPIQPGDEFEALPGGDHSLYVGRKIVAECPHEHYTRDSEMTKRWWLMYNNQRLNTFEHKLLNPKIFKRLPRKNTSNILKATAVPKKTDTPPPDALLTTMKDIIESVSSYGECNICRTQWDDNANPMHPSRYVSGNLKGQFINCPVVEYMRLIGEAE